MSDAFQLAMAFTKKWEGGYVNDPVDPGGETYRGITRKNWPDWAGWEYVEKRDLRKADEFVDEFYLQNFWLASGCDKMSTAAAICVFDSAVNCGVGRVKRWVVDLNVKDAVEAKRVSKVILQTRIAYYNSLVEKKPALKKFLKGWLNRVNDLSKYTDIVS